MILKVDLNESGETGPQLVHLFQTTQLTQLFQMVQINGPNKQDRPFDPSWLIPVIQLN